jgi:fatty acid desaturase
MRKKRTSENSSGQRSPDWPQSEASPIEIYRFYLDFYEKDFTRTRAVVKARASAVVVWSALLAALTAVVGAIISLTGFSWLGIVTVVLSGAAAVVAAWDSHFRHREHWKQKSSVLNELQLMKREFSFSLATQHDPDQ